MAERLSGLLHLGRLLPALDLNEQTMGGLNVACLHDIRVDCMEVKQVKPESSQTAAEVRLAGARACSLYTPNQLQKAQPGLLKPE